LKMVLADDHALFRGGLKMMLESQPEIEIVAEFENSEQLKKGLAPLDADIVVLDYHMPGGGVLELLGHIKSQSAAVKVIMLTGSPSAKLLRQLANSKADAVLLKSMSPDTLIQSIQLVYQGKRVYSPEVEKQRVASKPELTTREFQVLEHIVAGLGSADIADKLHLSSKTVENHRYNIMQKLGINNSVQLINYVHEHGLLER